jgi:hypothetical protein
MPTFSQFNLKTVEVLQRVLEPIQRQTKIVLSLGSWLTGVQQVANTFSQNVIPYTVYQGSINSSKGAFEYYLNTEYNIALWEDGVQKSFNLKIESNNDLVPTYLKADAGFYGSGTPTNTNFSHQLTISQIVGGVFIPQKIFL